MTNDTFLTVEEAAARLKIAPFTMRKWLRIGQVGGVKMGRVWRVPESSLGQLAATANASSTRIGPLAFASPDADPQTVAQLVKDARERADA